MQTHAKTVSNDRRRGNVEKAKVVILIGMKWIGFRLVLNGSDVLTGQSFVVVVVCCGGILKLVTAVAVDIAEFYVSEVC